jgi:hypothetical protein
MLTKARKKRTRPAWITGVAWTGLEDEWKKEKFLKISKQNKANRASKKGGALHTSGRKAHVDVALELVSIKFTFVQIITSGPLLWQALNKDLYYFIYF